MPHLLGGDEQLRSCPTAAWRARACFALEVTLDALARELWEGRASFASRAWCARKMSFDNVAEASFRQRRLSRSAAAMPRRRHLSAVREKQARRSGWSPDRIGIAMYPEAGPAPASTRVGAYPWFPASNMPCAAHARWRPGTSRRSAMVKGTRPRSRKSRTRSLACPTLIRLVHGDTAGTPYSTGTWGSRCMIVVGARRGGVRRIALRVKRIGAAFFRRSWRMSASRLAMLSPIRDASRSPSRPHLVSAPARAAGRRRSFRTRGDPRLQGRARPAFSYAAHAAVSPSIRKRRSRILDYVVVGTAACS